MTDTGSADRRPWPDQLTAPDPTRVESIFTLYWQALGRLPTLIDANENLLADALTTRLRDLVLEMMLALNGIAPPPNPQTLNRYLGDSQRAAIEKTLVAPSADPDTWIGRAVALTVIYQWYAPQLVDKYVLSYPHEFEAEIQAKLCDALPQWPQSITSE